MTENTNNKRPDLFNPVHFMACGFGSGLSVKAPGTMGTVVAWIVWLFLGKMSWPGYLCILVLAIILGIWLCGRTARDLQTHDAPSIVWDEFCGYWLTMLFAPAGILWSVYGFVLFRIFDIVKPWPIKWADRHLQGGVGIMVDDLMAGFFSMLILQITVYLMS